MAPQIYKREAPEEEEINEEELEVTTYPTKIFGKHLHKVKLQTTTEPIEEGNLSYYTSLIQL